MGTSKMTCGLIASCALLALGSGLVFGACVAENEGDDPVSKEVRVSAIVLDENASACGEPAWIYMLLEDESGNQIWCEEPMSPVELSGPITGNPDPEDKSHHQAGDCYFILGSGTYAVVDVQLWDAEHQPLTCCEVTEQPEAVTVYPEVTTDFQVYFTCGQSNGGTNGTGITNWKPKITDLEFDPDKWNAACSPTVVTVTATDRDDDVLSFVWELVWAPEDAVFSWHADGPVLTFVSATALADYQMRVTVTDEHGASTKLTFPLHFVGEDGSCPELVPGT